MFKRLRIRLTVICTLITGIILAGMAWGAFYISQSQLTHRAQASFLSDMNSILFHLQSQTFIDHTWLSQTEANGNLMIDIMDKGIPILYSKNKQGEIRTQLFAKAYQTALEEFNFDVRRPPDSHLQAQQVNFEFVDYTGQKYYGAVASVPLSKGWIGITIVKSQIKDEQQIFYLFWTFLGLTLLSIFFLGLFAWLFTARAIKPVEESRKRQIEFVSAASHELRSPLAVIQASISAMESASLTQAQRFSQTITEECRRMSQLIADMLTLAGADSGTWPVHWEEAEMETLVLSAAEHFEPIAEKKKISITSVLPDTPLPKCRCDILRIDQVLSILLDNAISYTPEGGKIVLTLTRYHKSIQIRVIDNGPGIPNELKEAIFQRFYRVDSSRSKKDHYGLGLCIAREIAALHRGKLLAEDTPGGGSTFVLSLPIE